MNFFRSITEECVTPHPHASYLGEGVITLNSCITDSKRLFVYSDFINSHIRIIFIPEYGLLQLLLSFHLKFQLFWDVGNYPCNEGGDGIHNKLKNENKGKSGGQDIPVLTRALVRISVLKVTLIPEGAKKKVLSLIKKLGRRLKNLCLNHL